MIQPNQWEQKHGLIYGLRVYCPSCFQRNKELIRMEKKPRTTRTYKCPKCEIVVRRNSK